MKTKYKLREIAPSIPSDKSQISDKIWLLNLDRIEPHTGRLLTKDFVAKANIGASTHQFDEGNILYSKLRPYLNKVYLPDESGFCTSEFVPMRPKPGLVIKEYLAAYLRSSPFLHWVNQQIDGAKMPRVSMKIFWEHEIELPNLEEQRRIAMVFDKLDNLHRKRQEAMSVADEFLRAAFIEIFGDPVDNPRGWPIQPLELLGNLDRGVSKHRPRNDPSLLGGNYPLIQTGDVANCDGYIRTFKNTYSEKGLRQSKLWPEGTLCITIAANIANTGILLFPACFPDSVVGFSAPSRATAEYVRFWLSFLQRTLEENAPASAQKNINLAILRNLNIPVPPKELVERFANIVSRIETIRNTQRKALDDCHIMTRALEHKLFMTQSKSTALHGI